MAVFEPDTQGLMSKLDNYDRCMQYTVKDDGTIRMQSGKHPHWRRFQRDVHGPTLNIQGHGYAMTEVHRRHMLENEVKADPAQDFYFPADTLTDRPHTTILTLTPIINLINEGIKGPSVRP